MPRFKIRFDKNSGFNEFIVDYYIISPYGALILAGFRPRAFYSLSLRGVRGESCAGARGEKRPAGRGEVSAAPDGENKAAPWVKNSVQELRLSPLPRRSPAGAETGGGYLLPEVRDEP